MNFHIITDNFSYLMLGAWPDGPLGGAALTLALSAVCGVASALLGLVIGIALSYLKGLPLAVLRLVVGFLRAIPVIMLIFWCYFLLPMAFGIDVPGFGAVTLALSLIGGAYLGHSVYAGITGIAVGQSEAATALGLTRWQTLRLVILPQALPMMAPSFINQWVSLIKDSSLAYVVGVAELSFVATQVSNREIVYPAEIFLFTGLVYFVICSALEFGALRVAKHYRGYVS